MRIETPNKKQEQYVDRTRQTFKDIKGFRKKVQYIWEYYHVIFFTFIACAVLIGGTAASIYHNMKYETIFYCTIINNTMLEDTKDTLTQDFSAYIELDENNNTITFDDSLLIDYAENSPHRENSYYSVQKVTALIAARSVDCFLTNKEVAEAYATTAAFYDLNQLLPQDLKEALSDRLLTYTAYEDEEASGTNGAYLIDISGTEFAEKYGIYMDSAYIGVLINSEHTDSAISFIRFIFGL